MKKDYLKKYISLKLAIIPLCPPNHNGVSDRHKQYCQNPGKVPIVSKWQECQGFTMDKWDVWLANDSEINLGMVLGSRSGVVAIDVDGEAGEKILAEWSNDDLPLTWEFTTPGGGRRLIYKIPDGMILKKYSRAAAEDHAECALLGEGQQTVMPPSKHANGGIYRWISDRAPWECELCMAPEWMIKKMKRGAKTVEKTTGKDQKDGLTKAIYLLENKCKCFAEDIKIQQEGHLCEEQWFKWCTCLTMAGFPKSAVAFSKASFKHNARSEQRLNELAEQQGKIGMVRCTTFGCSNEEICKCFKKSVCMQNKEHTTSPGSHLLQATKKKKEVDKEELERIGISINKHGNLEDLNGNKFARYILEEVDLIYTPGDQFYLYSDGVYKIIEANLLSRLLRNKLHQFVPDAWTERLEQIYLTALERETTYVESINQNRNYLNLINGLFNLETMELESHRKDVYSSIRIPIKYDSEAKCPRFMQFMDEVLGSDQERIDTLGEYMGYSMTAETRGEKALVLYGKGANGKSVLSNIFIELCGQENVATIPLQDLDNPFKRSALVGKLVNLVTENELGKKGLNTQYFKGIVSGDTIDAEIKHGAAFSFRPVCKLIFALNNLFYCADSSHGFYRRLLLLTFDRKFDGQKEDKDLLEKLKGEMSGILNFALQSLQRLRKNQFRFTKSQRAEETLKEYRKGVDPVYEFCMDMIEQAPLTSKVINKNLHDVFRNWCQANGNKILSDIKQRNLTERVKDILADQKIPFDVGGSNGQRYIVGIRLKLSNAEELEMVDDIDQVG